MTKKQVRELVLRETGSDHIDPGYHYTIMAIRTTRPVTFRERLKESRAAIERQAGIKLLDFVGLIRPRSVLVPIPLHCKVNEVSQAISDHVTNIKFEMPFWG